MSDGYRVGAYWGASAETALQVAGRLTDCLHRLSGLHPALSGWRDSWESEEDWLAGPKQPWTVDPPSMAGLIESGRSHDDAGAVVEELGYLVGGWTGGWEGNDEAGTSVLVRAGAYAQWMAPNFFMLELPSSQDAPAGLFDAAILRAVLEVVVESWQPRWASFTCDRLVDAQQPSRILDMSDPDFEREFNQPTDTQRTMPTVGWLTYIETQDSPQVPAENFPNGVVIERISQGTLFALGDDPLAVDEQDAVALYRMLERPFNVHPFTGVRKDESFDFAAYRAKATGVPGGLDYVANGYRFDGYRDGKLLYAFDQYQFEAENGQLIHTQIRDEFLATARAQLQAAQGYPVIWFFPQNELARAVQVMLANENISDIYVRSVE